MEKMHRLLIEETNSALTSGLAHKNTSSLRSLRNLWEWNPCISLPLELHKSKKLLLQLCHHMHGLPVDACVFVYAKIREPAHCRSERCCTAARCNSIHQQVSITFSKDYNPLVILPPKSPSPSLTASTLKQPKAVFAIIHLFSLKFEVNNTKRLHKYQTPCADRVSQNGFYVTGISTVKKNKTD